LNILTIDTATPIEIIAIGDDKSTKQAITPLSCSHSITLFDNIQKCLNDSGLTIKDVDLIGVGTGPGSFTGIRIAVSTARMLAQLLNKPLVGVKTTLIYAVSASCAQGDNILIAFDAKKKRVFGAVYQQNRESIPTEIVPPGDYSMEHLCDRCVPGRNTVAIGDGVGRYYDIVAEKITSLDFRTNFIPEGKAATSLVLKIYNSNPELYRDFRKTVPFYARKSDAEIALAAKKTSVKEGEK